ncbi:MAG: MoaD/ThiS family protein [Candidatus Thorarchaeota archaeon]
MISIKLFFYSLLADKFGKEEIALNFDHNIILRDLLNKLKSLLGSDFEKTNIISEGMLNKYIILALNGKHIRKFEGLDTIIKDGDELSFLPAIAGG